MRVTATPATASTLPIQFSERSVTGGRAGAAGGGTGGRCTGACGTAYCGAATGYGNGAAQYWGCGWGWCASRRSSSTRSAETRDMYAEIAAKSADNRLMTARCGSVIADIVQRNRAEQMSRTTRPGRVRSRIWPIRPDWPPAVCGTSPARGSPQCGDSTRAAWQSAWRSTLSQHIATPRFPVR